MQPQWKVSHNYAGSSTFIQVYHLLDAEAVDHSGNRVYYPEIFPNDAAAEEMAAKLNRGEVEYE